MESVLIATCLLSLASQVLGQGPTNMGFGQSATQRYLYYNNFRSTATGSALNGGNSFTEVNCYDACVATANCLAVDFDSTAAATSNCVGYTYVNSNTACTGCGTSTLIVASGTRHIKNSVRCIASTMRSSGAATSSGTSLASITIPLNVGATDEHCRNACEITDSCVAVNYNTGTRVCSLLSSTTTNCLTRSALAGTNTYYKPCVGSNGGFTTVDSIFQGYASDRINITSRSFNTDPATCETLCNSFNTMPDSYCTGFSYLYINPTTDPLVPADVGRCRLYLSGATEACTPPSAVVNQASCSSTYGQARNWYTFRRQAGCTALQFYGGYYLRFYRTFSSNQLTTGAVIFSSSTTDALCAQSCMQDSTCGGFDFQGTTCYKVPTTVSCTAARLTGGTFTHYRIDTLCRSKTFDSRRSSFVDRNNIQPVLTATLPACIAACEANTNCRALSYNAIIQRCYLDTSTSTCGSRTVNENCCISMRRKFSCATAAGFASSRDNFTIPASGVLSVQGSINSEATCLSQCVAATSPVCAGVLWTRNSLTCAFYQSTTTTAACNLGALSDNSVVHSRGNCGSSCLLNMFQSSSSRRHSLSVMQLDIFGVGACSYRCFNDQNCGGFDMSGDVCYIISVATECSIATTATVSFTHYQKNYACMRSTYDDRPQSYITLANPQSGSVPFSTCQTLCSNDANCRGLSYNGASQTCYLDTTNNANCVARVSNQYCFVSLRVKHRCATQAGFVSSQDNMRLPTANQALQSGITSEASCLSNCQASITCAAAMWDRTASQCYFFLPSPFSSSAGCTITESDTCCVVHHKGTCGSTTACTQVQNTKVFGGTFQGGIGTVTACDAACRASPSTCSSFDWEKNFNRCWFHSSAATCNIQVTDTNVDHYRCASPDPCFTSYTSVRVDGGTLQSGVSTLTDCRSACISDGNCRGFSFVPNSCYLHTDTDVCNSFSTCSSCTHERKTTWECTWTMVGLRIASGGLQNGINTVPDCEKSCRLNSGCRGFDYVPSSNQCYLHLVGTICNAKIVDSNVNHYRLRSHTCSGEAFTATQNAGITGGSNQGTKASALACYLECEAVSTCSGVDFDKTTRECRHFVEAQECTGANPNTCCDHIRKPTACTAAQCTLVTTNNMNKQGATRVNNIASQEACKDSCCADSTCLSVDWDKTTNQCWKHSLTSHCNNQLESQTCCNHHAKPSAAGTCSGGDFTQTMGNLKQGALQIPAASEPDCVQLCRTDNNCGGVDWDKTSDTCWKHDITNECGITLMPNPCCNHWEKDSACVTQGDFTQRIGNNKQGAAPIPAGSETACVQACRTDTSCGGVDWDTTSNTCWRHDTNNECATSLAPNNCCNHWEKDSACGTQGDFTQIIGNNKQGAAPISAGSETACVQACRADTSCGGVDWDTTSNTCWRHDTNNECAIPLAPNNCCNHWGKDAACGVPFAGFASFNGMNRQGATQTSETTEASCVANCQSSNSCRGVDWDKTSSTCWQHLQPSVCNNLDSHPCCNSHTKTSVTCP